MSMDFNPPLKDKNVLVTRGEKQSGKLSERLREHGANPIEVPVLHFGAPASWEELDAALRSIDQYDWIAFASANAVTAVLDRCTTLGIRLADAENLKVAAIGSSTERQLAEAGLSTSFRPSAFVAEKFITEFPNQNIHQTRILWPRTNIGRTLIADRLRASGATVDAIEAYTTGLPPDSDRIAETLVQTLAPGSIDIVTLASSQTVKNFAELIQKGCASTEHTIESLLKNVLIASIGPITSDTTRELLGRVDIEAQVFTVDGLIDSLVKTLTQA